MFNNISYFGIAEHPMIIFFQELNSFQEEKAKLFLLDFISDFNADSLKMNAVFGVIRKVFQNFFEYAFQHYLSLNSDLECFKEVNWIGHGGVYSGHVIVGQLRANDWLSILEISRKPNNQIALIPIRRFIKENIDDNLRSAERERMRDFLNPDKL
jgi:hypothetical protein